MNKILAIIQARQNSSRLPNKVLEYFSGNYLIGHVIERLRYSQHIQHILVATGPERLNEQLIDVCKENIGVEVFCGDDADVLGRFYHAAQPHSPDVIVRVTADDPLKDSAVIDHVIDIMVQSRENETTAYDYVSNTLRPTYPEGLDIEVMAFAALEQAFHAATLASEREHVTPFIWKNPQCFRLHNFENAVDLSHLRWTVDVPEDLEFIKEIYHYFEGKPYFDMQDVLRFIEMHPDLSRTNRDIERNQSYNKMVAHEQ